MIKKILLCTPYHSAFTYPVETTLENMGYSVKVFDYRKGNVFSRTLGFVKNKLLSSDSTLNPKLHQNIQNQLLHLVSKWQPDLLFVIKGENLTIDTLKHIKLSGIKTINWYPDWLVTWDWVRMNAGYYDYFFSMCEELTIKTRTININSVFLLPASMPDQNLNFTRDIPVSFVGQSTKRRELFFSQLTDLGLNIWGYERWKTSSLKKYYHSQVSIQKCLHIIRNSKITVNVLTGDDKHQPSAINVRTFESLGTGTFLLVQDNPLLYRYFQPGKDFVTFKTPQELRKKAKYYLTHEKERQKIAEHGWNTVRSKHTYDVRLGEVFKYIND